MEKNIEREESINLIKKQIKSYYGIESPNELEDKYHFIITTIMELGSL